MDLDPRNQIIVALDVPTLREAHLLAEQLTGHVGGFKVGLELLTSEGAPEVVRELLRFGLLFYDGKFDDIPNTVSGASKAVANMGVWMFNVHASAGIDVMFAAVDNKGSAMVTAVTVLTSREENDAHTTFHSPTKAKVLQMAREAVLAGCDGIVCSPQELPLIKSRRELKRLLTVVPGVRPLWASPGDQKRVMTPGEAVKAGADYLVIGRPITKPPVEIGGPVEAVQKILEEITAAMAAA